MKRIGLKPGNERQLLPGRAGGRRSRSIPRKSSFEITGPDGAQALKFADEVAFWTPRFDKTDQKVENSDLVFVGYGVVAPRIQMERLRRHRREGQDGRHARSTIPASSPATRRSSRARP